MSMMLVALRKESVDRNADAGPDDSPPCCKSLSARRAWIEMPGHMVVMLVIVRRSPQGERG